MNDVLVSVCCITYNHEKFIGQAIEGFLIQKTNFPFEIIIHDDASTDSTANIIREYAKKDSRIRAILRETNIKSTGTAVFPITFEMAKGKYIAMCEGDDYWTDPLKLQKQADFLEMENKYSLVYSARTVVDRRDNIKREEIPLKQEYTILDIFNGMTPYTQTMMFRNNSFLITYFLSNDNIYSGDRTIAYICAMTGNIYCLSDITAAYRETGTGIWSKHSSVEKWITHEEQQNRFHLQLGWDINNPTYIHNAFNNLVTYLFMGIRRPNLFFDKKYRKQILLVWKKFRYMNRYKFLAQAVYKKVVSVFKKV